MRYNGLYVVIDMAVREVDDPLFNRHKATLLLGSLREDVWYLPGLRVIYEHLSFTHFSGRWLAGGFLPLLWPGPRLKANLFFGRALREYRKGRVASAMVQLGRAAHLLTDMACPVHAQRVIHETDPYEWYIEGNQRELRALPAARIGEFESAGEIVRALARFTQGFEPDRTNNAFGRLMKRLGFYRSPTRAELAEQAGRIIPEAAGYMAALLRLFLRECGSSAESSPSLGAPRAAPT